VYKSTFLLYPITVVYRKSDQLNVNNLKMLNIRNNVCVCQRVVAGQAWYRSLCV